MPRTTTYIPINKLPDGVCCHRKDSSSPWNIYMHQAAVQSFIVNQLSVWCSNCAYYASLFTALINIHVWGSTAAILQEPFGCRDWCAFATRQLKVAVGLTGCTSPVSYAPIGIKRAVWKQKVASFCMRTFCVSLTWEYVKWMRFCGTSPNAPFRPSRF